MEISLKKYGPRRKLLYILPVFVLIYIQCRLAAQSPMPAATQAAARQPDFEAIDALMLDAVTRGNIPGGVVLIGHNGRVVYRKAFGSRSLEPTREPMTVDTIFDLASLTKCIATTTSVMQLISEGRVRLNDPVSAYLPEFRQNGKEDITVRELLTHFSGLAPDLDLNSPWQGRDTAFAMAMQARPIYPPGTRNKHVDNHDIWVDPKNNNHYLVGCDGGLYESFDRAATWNFKENLPTAQMYDVAVSEDEGFV